MPHLVYLAFTLDAADADVLLDDTGTVDDEVDVVIGGNNRLTADCGNILPHIRLSIRLKYCCLPATVLMIYKITL